MEEYKYYLKLRKKFPFIEIKKRPLSEIEKIAINYQTGLELLVVGLIIGPLVILINAFREVKQ